MTGHVDLEALVLGPELGGRPQVPLPQKSGAVTVSGECLGQGHLAQRHAINQRCRQESPASPSNEPVRRVHARRITPGHDAEPGGTTNRVGRVAVGKSHAGRRQPIHIGCLVKGPGIVGPNIHVTKVIDQHENNIGLPGENRCRSEQQQGHQQKRTTWAQHQEHPLESRSDCFFVRRKACRTSPQRSCGSVSARQSPGLRKWRRSQVVCLST